MAREVKMPKMSGTTEEVVLLRWRVKVGDTVKRGDVLCEVETDKTTLDVETFEAGTVLSLNASEQATVVAGDVIAVLGEAGEPLPAPAPAEAPTAEGTRGPTRPATPGGAPRASAMVQNRAAKRSVDLAAVRGTGPGGLITRDDLERYLAGAPAPAAPEATEPAPVHAAGRLSPAQASLGRALSQWWSATPHFYLKMSVNAGPLLARRAAQRRPDGRAVSLNALVLHALARVLGLYPRLRQAWKDGDLTPPGDAAVGLAVAVGEDLAVPVVRGADRKSVLEIDNDIAHLVARARERRLESADVTGGVFTLTNLGMLGVDEFAPVVAPGQSGILALGRVRKSLEVADDGSMSVRDVAVLTAAFDHRVVNGAQAASFMAALRKQMEEREHHA